MRLLNYILPAIVCVTVWSCSSENKPETKTVETPSEELTTSVNSDFLEHLVDSSWHVLDSNETVKMALIKRLHDEISYNPAHNPAELQEIRQSWVALNQTKLTQKNLSQEGLIDSFDVESDSLILASAALVTRTPNMENYPLCNELISEINDINATVILQERIVYSSLVESYNQSLNDEGKKLPSFYVD